MVVVFVPPFAIGKVPVTSDVRSTDVPRVEAIVTLSVAPAVVVIPDPASIVSVSPDVIVWATPEVPDKVNKVVDVERHVGQEMSPADDKDMGEEADTATVPEASGNVIVRSTVGSVIEKVV